MYVIKFLLLKSFDFTYGYFTLKGFALEVVEN